MEQNDDFKQYCIIYIYCSVETMKMVNISQTLCRERKTDYKFLVYLFINQGEMLHSGDAELVSGIRYI